MARSVEPGGAGDLTWIAFAIRDPGRRSVVRTERTERRPARSRRSPAPTCWRRCTRRSPTGPATPHHPFAAREADVAGEEHPRGSPGAPEIGVVDGRERDRHPGPSFASDQASCTVVAGFERRTEAPHRLEHVAEGPRNRLGRCLPERFERVGFAWAHAVPSEQRVSTRPRRQRPHGEGSPIEATAASLTAVPGHLGVKAARGRQHRHRRLVPRLNRLVEAARPIVTISEERRDQHHRWPRR